MKTLTAILVLCFASLAGAQITTVYTIPAGDECPNVEGCYYHNLTSTAADGTTLWGLFMAGMPQTQFDYQAFEGQNPGYKALYCNGTQVWTSATIDETHGFWTMDCQANSDSTSADPPATLHAEITAHKISFVQPCGRWLCHITQWIVDEGTLAITQ